MVTEHKNTQGAIYLATMIMVVYLFMAIWSASRSERDATRWILQSNSAPSNSNPHPPILELQDLLVDIVTGRHNISLGKGMYV
jgi:hypothetical protein